MPYKLRFPKIAEKDILRLKKSEPNAYKKVLVLLREIVVTPYTGKGKPKTLSGDRVYLKYSALRKPQSVRFTVEATT